jgi:hypothetical protein
MFPAGQRVWLRSGQGGGIVLECAGGRVYIEQDNGVEADFAAADVTTAPPATAKPHHPPAPPSAAAPDATRIRTLTARDITPEHARVLAIIPVRILKAVAALYERRPDAGRFSALDTAAKLNVIAAITAVPYSTMRRYDDNPGELSLLMGKGLADSSRGV